MTQLGLLEGENLDKLANYLNEILPTGKEVRLWFGKVMLESLQAQRDADQKVVDGLEAENTELKKECDCHEELLRKCNAQEIRIKQYEEMWGDITRQDFLKLPHQNVLRKVIAKIEALL